jgi:hypothetical protein
MYNQKHFWEVVEHHTGSSSYYINEMKKHFNSLNILFPVGILFSLKAHPKRLIRLLVLTLVISIYMFFTIAATKLTSYIMVVMPIIFVYIAQALILVFNFVMQNMKSNFLFFVLMAIIVYINLNPYKILEDHGFSKSLLRKEFICSNEKNAITFKKVSKINFIKKTVIIGVEDYKHIECMFYTSLPTYGYYIPKILIDSIKRKEYDIAVFRNQIPPTLLHDTSIIILPFDYAI